MSTRTDTARMAPQVEILHGSGASIARVTGVIDERFPPGAFAQLGGRKEPVCIDLDGCVRITSFGVREWMRSLRDIDGQSYFFARVRPAILAQFNSVNQFGGRGQIISFYCPYLCPNCDTSFEVLLDMRRQASAVRGRAAAMPCPSCKLMAEFDDVEATYFAFVASAPPLNVPPAIDAAHDGTTAKLPLHVHKTIEGDLTVLWLRGAVDKGGRLRRHSDGLEGKVLIVLESVEAPTTEGVRALGELFANAGADVHVARITIELVRSLAAQAAADGSIWEKPPQIISYMMPTRCSSCGLVGELELRRRASGREPKVCERCGERQRAVQWQDGDTDALEAMRFPEVPEEIEAFMREHADWQTHTSVAGKSAPRLNAPHGLTMAINPGTRIGRYEVIRRIGTGGMADVLLGRQLGVEGFEKKVVIKRILPHLARQENFIKMFIDEARVAARLLHGNIVQVHDLIHEGDDYYAILELVRGADLNVCLKTCARHSLLVPVEIACRIIVDVCAGLHAAHSYVDDDGHPQPIIHRDVSPHNVLISNEGAVKLTDFGIAKAADSLSEDTDTGILKGKVMYMPPEAILGNNPDHRADVYAAAVVLYQVLAGGKNPFNRGGQAPSMRAVLDETPLPIDEQRRDVPRKLGKIVARGMAREPQNRYQTAAAFAADLEQFLLGFGKPAGNAVVGSWLKDVLARNREATNVPAPVLGLGLGLPLPSDPARGGAARPAAADEDATSVTTPARAVLPEGAGSGSGTGAIDDDWLEMENLASENENNDGDAVMPPVGKENSGSR